jgi:streptogramin lyase
MDRQISKHRSKYVLSVGVVLFAAQLACSGLTGPAGEPTKEPQATAATKAAAVTKEEQPTAAATRSMEAEPTATKWKPPSGGSGEGYACFGTDLYGVTCLTNAGWETYTSENTDLKSDGFDDLAACPDGNIYAATGYGAGVFDGSQWTYLEIADDKTAQHVACAPDGSVWFGYYGGVARFADGEWTTFASAEFDTGDYPGTVNGVEVAPDGTVWVAADSSIAKFDGSAWTEFKEGNGFDAEPSIYRGGLAVDSQGRVWAGGYKEIYLYEDGKWTTIELDRSYTVRSLVADPQNRLWVNTDEGALVYDGSDWSVLSYRTGEIHGNGVLAAAFDQAGRTWLGMRYGIDVLVDGTWYNYRMDNAGLVDNEISSVAVVGEGPALPDPLTKQTGSISGKVTKGGEPFADARIEFCVESIAMYYTGDTPCSQQPYQKESKTNADGEFSVNGLPVGYYVLTIQVGDKWAQLGILGSSRILVEEGKDTDIGEMTIKEE